MRRLSGMDAAFLYLENAGTTMLVQAIMLLDPSTVPGGYSFEKIKRTSPSGCRCCRSSASGSRSCRSTCTARCGSTTPTSTSTTTCGTSPYRNREASTSSTDIIGDIAGRPLDRARPLWEFWVIEGVENDTVAVLARMHHATIDGVSGSSLATSILDLEAEPDGAADRSTTGSPSTSRPTSSWCATRSSRGCGGRCRSPSRSRRRTSFAARSTSRGSGGTRRARPAACRSWRRAHRSTRRSHPTGGSRSRRSRSTR